MTPRIQQRSVELFAQAQQYLPGGVNSPVRAFKGVGGTPVFMQRAAGAYLYDVDNHRYIDYVCGWGPLILGHAHPHVLSRLQTALNNGICFGTATELEITLAQKIMQHMPSIEMLRMVNSGTEATTSAIRLARAFSKRNKIIKFNGCYHGHCDSLLVKAGSGNLTFAVPDSAGVPASLAADTLVAEYNDLAHVQQLFAEYADEIAAIIVEPVAANMNCVLPQPGFLQGLRALCDSNNSVLIFDEVITGFRLGLGGATAHFNVKPDLITLGKIIGGGLPIGAFGGKQEIMQMLAPLGPVYQAGTLSGNPLTMTAGIATLDVISEPDFYAKLQTKTQQLVTGLLALSQQHHIEMQINHIESIMGLYFTTAPQVTNFHEVMSSSREHYQQFFHAMLMQGIYLAPSAFEVAFMSAAHSDSDITTTLTAAEQALATIKK